MTVRISDIVCLEAVVMYGDGEITCLHMHSVPRSLFDLIPGEPVEHRLAARVFWTKSMMLVGEPGKHAPMMAYCDEGQISPTPPPTSQIDRGGDGEALLCEHQPDSETGMDAPAG